jgi:topoisomerase-4 subunit A
MLGEPEDRWLLACDGGPGFVTRLESLFARNRSGKAVFNLPANARMLPACPVPAGGGALVCAVNSEGRLLAFPAADLPEMEKGRGNLVFGIPGKKAKAREELMIGVAVVAEGGKLAVFCGDRKMTLSWKDLEHYRGERGQRGAVLPRGWRKVDRVEAE